MGQGTGGSPAQRVEADVTPSASPTLPDIQRQEAKKEEKGQEKEAAKKVGEAFLKTPIGERIKQEASAKGKEFISTLQER
jgi:hypothetical protein